jgi:hypothetical protein
MPVGPDVHGAIATVRSDFPRLNFPCHVSGTCRLICPLSTSTTTWSEGSGCVEIAAPNTPSAIHDSTEAAAPKTRRCACEPYSCKDQEAGAGEGNVRNRAEVARSALSADSPRITPLTNDAAIAAAGNFMEHVSIARAFQCGRSGEKGRIDEVPISRI